MTFTEVEETMVTLIHMGILMDMTTDMVIKKENLKRKL
jgi:hypothetical protein